MTSSSAASSVSSSIPSGRSSDSRPRFSGLDPADVREAYAHACSALGAAQRDEGAWAGEVVWNPMLICQYVISCHIIGHTIPSERKRRILRSLELQQKADGGWGMHPDAQPLERPSDPSALAGQDQGWMFHTVLVYLALRLLGEPAQAPLCRDTLAWIHTRGGPYNTPTWGRAWLAMLGLYPWDELQPLVPELWLLPEASPIHPRRLYCHMRLIYLGLSYLYGAKTRADDSPLLAALRSELYPEGWSLERFAASRDSIASSDLYEPLGPALETVFRGARWLARSVPARLRERALAKAWTEIEFELDSTNWICLSPVNGMLFCLAMWTRDRRDPRLAQALEGLEYWVWEDEEEGLRIAGARSDIWDTSFALQALCEGPDSPQARELAGSASRWLARAQMREEVAQGHAHHRESALGGWGFADEHHPWPVSDCTAEALEALLAVEHRGWQVDENQLPLAARLDALRFILLRQNDDGGFGSYEPRRGSMLLARFNPAEMYGNCMLEYSYTECTASCVRALGLARKTLDRSVPPRLRVRLDAALDAGVSFLLAQQNSNGAWPGFWGVNYTYGTYFAVAALLAAGLDQEHSVIRRAVRYLLSAQRDDGGWGESYEGVLESREVALPSNQPSPIVQTSWAILTLQAAAPERARHAIDAGIELLLARQSPEGGWPHDLSVGVFFNTAVLDYRLFKLVFPTWVLARWLGREK